MNTATHRLLLPAAGVAFAGVAALTVFTTAGTGDYQALAPVAGDNAAPALTALTHGDVGSFVSHQPLMGLVSLVVRAPAVLVASAVGAGPSIGYRLGALVCLLALVLGSAVLVSVPGVRSVERLPALAAALLLLAGPATVAAVSVGHPEEVLAITFATGAVVAALAGQPLLTAVLLGLAIGTKPWALLAAGPIAVALPAARARTLALAAVLALPCIALLPLADPAAFSRAGAGIGAMRQIDPFSLWWPIGTPVGSVHRLPLGLDRSLAILVGLTLALGAVVWRASWSARHGRELDPLALLALIGVVRCAVDPVPLEYNLVVCLVPLAAWEVLERGRLPVVSGLTALVGALLLGGKLHLAPSLQSALSIAGIVALAAYLERDAVHRRIRSLAPDAVTHTRSMPSLASGAPA